MIQAPEFITFTGVDEQTDVQRMLSLAGRYPVEWGVLFSPKLQGLNREPRFPSLDFVRRLMHVADGRLRLSAHLCGGHASRILIGGLCGVEGWLDEDFARFQVNTADPDADTGTVRRFAEAMTRGGRGILQCRGAFPRDPEVDWLFDASGGRGIVPDAWPEAPDDGTLVGFAGGIGPDNAARTVAAIGASHVPGRRYWIDMETRVRTEDGFDLDKCEAVCAAIYGPR